MSCSGWILRYLGMSLSITQESQSQHWKLTKKFSKGGSENPCADRQKHHQQNIWRGEEQQVEMLWFPWIHIQAPSTATENKGKGE